VTSKLETLAARLDSLTKEASDIAGEMYKLVIRQRVPRNITVDGVRNSFTTEQLEFLQVSDEKDHVRVAFNKFVPDMVFRDVANRAEGSGGKYFKKTVETAPHFKIPKQV